MVDARDEFEGGSNGGGAVPDVRWKSNAVPNLEQIEERTANATAGPWRVEGSYDERYFVEDDEGEPVAAFRYAWAAYHGPDLRLHDAEFIAHAREDVPRLVARVRVLEEHRENVARLYADLQEQNKNCGEELSRAKARLKALDDISSALDVLADLKAQETKYGL